MSTVMSKTNREQFLAGVHIGILSVAEDGRGPLTVPVWYDYQPGGEVRIWSGAAARKLHLVRAAGRFSLCAQEEALPYKYVSVEGPVVAIETADFERDIRSLAVRYMNEDGAKLFLESIGGAEGTAGDLLIRMRPERWYSADFSLESGAND